MQLRPILRGLKTFVAREPDRKGTGGTVSARYCYAVWLRHLVHMRLAGLEVRPTTVAELGPGDSLGIGLAALLTGADQYHGFDVVKHANNETNLQVFEDLVRLFHERADIPGLDEFPEIRPILDSHGFPADVLTNGRLSESLRPKRVEAIRDALTGIGSGGPASACGVTIQYTVPWSDAHVVRESSVDMLFSQATLEHVANLDNVYRAMHLWLAPGGVMTHQIDFRSHGTSREWNGHWEYPDALWKIVRGRRSFLLNREPWSTHKKLLRKHGFDILHEVLEERRDGLRRKRLASTFRHLSEEDITTAGAFYAAIRRQPPRP